MSVNGSPPTDLLSSNRCSCSHNLITIQIQRSRGWCFTLNNWDGTSLGILQTRFEAGNPVYVCWGKETGESGTPHLQGYARFRDAIGLSGVRKLLETAHWEPRKGTEPQAIAYCEKDGDFTELGDRAAPGKRTDVTSFLACVREGAGALELSESHPLEFVKFHRAAEVLRGGMGIPRQEKTTVHWYHGSTGTGKSRQAFEENEGAYWKDMSNGQWWDGYEQQECVVFDDMRKDTSSSMSFCGCSTVIRYGSRLREGTGSSIPKKSLLLVVQHQTICMQHDVMKTCNNCYDVLK